MATQKRKWSGRSYANAPAEENARRAAVPQQEMLARAFRSRAPGQPTDSRLEQARHQTGAVHVAIRVLGDQAAACSVNVKRRAPGSGESDGDDDATPVPYDHPLARLMRRPNNKETGGMLRRRMVQQLQLTGSALVWRLLDGTGTPAEMWSIPSGTWQPLMRSPAWPEGAYRVTPYYAYGPFATTPGFMQPGGVIIPSEEIVRADFPHPLVSYDAYSPLTACALQLDALEAVDKSRWYAMKNGVNPSAVVELDPSMGGSVPPQDEIDRLKEEFHARYGGPENTGRVAVLTPGAKLNPYSHSPADMMFESQWSQLVDFVLSVFGVTKTLGFMGEASSYAALYASLKQFTVLSLKPLLQLLADAINVQLVWPFWGEEYFVEFEPAAIDDDDLKLKVMQSLSAIGAITVNEYRTSLGLTAVPWGERPAVPGGQADDMAKAGIMDLDPANDGQLQDEQPMPQTQAPQARAAMPTPGRASEGSLPGRMAGMNGNGRH